MEAAETKKWERENGNVAISFFIGEERDGNEKRNKKNIKEKWGKRN